MTENTPVTCYDANNLLHSFVQRKYLKKPSVNWVAPAKNVAVRQRCRKITGSFIGSTISRSKVPSRRDTIETGPMAMSLELPMKA